MIDGKKLVDRDVRRRGIHQGDAGCDIFVAASRGTDNAPLDRGVIDLNEFDLPSAALRFARGLPTSLVAVRFVATVVLERTNVKALLMPPFGPGPSVPKSGIAGGNRPRSAPATAEVDE
ncbi:hypothetical protein ACFIOY_26595 [Bradyrhizobium sp. TZ2]